MHAQRNAFLVLEDECMRAIMKRLDWRTLGRMLAVCTKLTAIVKDVVTARIFHALKSLQGSRDYLDW